MTTESYFDAINKSFKGMSDILANSKKIINEQSKRIDDMTALAKKQKIIPNNTLALHDEIDKLKKQIEELLIINKMHVNHIYELETRLKST